MSDDTGARVTLRDVYEGQSKLRTEIGEAIDLFRQEIMSFIGALQTNADKEHVALNKRIDRAEQILWALILASGVMQGINLFAPLVIPNGADLDRIIIVTATPRPDEIGQGLPIDEVRTAIAPTRIPTATPQPTYTPYPTPTIVPDVPTITPGGAEEFPLGTFDLLASSLRIRTGAGITYTQKGAKCRGTIPPCEMSFPVYCKQANRDGSLWWAIDRDCTQWVAETFNSVSFGAVTLSPKR